LCIKISNACYRSNKIIDKNCNSSNTNFAAGPEDAAILLDAGNLSSFIGLFPFSKQHLVFIFVLSDLFVIFNLVRVIEVKVLG